MRYETFETIQLILGVTDKYLYLNVSSCDVIIFQMGRNARSSRCIRTSLPSNMCDVVSFASYGEEIQTDDNLEG